MFLNHAICLNLFSIRFLGSPPEKEERITVSCINCYKDNVSWCYVMDKTQIIKFGSWLDAVGTTLSAIGNTPFTFISENRLKKIDLIGDILQATASSIMADAEENFNLFKIGNIIDASGNVIEIAGNVLPFPNKRSNQILAIEGNGLQTLGTGLSFIYCYENAIQSEFELNALYGIYGTLIQTIGLAMQTIAATLPEDHEIGNRLNTVGCWVQAIGAILEAIGASIEDGHYC